MNNYKELLSQIAYCASDGGCDGCPLNSDNMLALCVDELFEKASDAIEQLCTDVARLEEENRAKEQYIAETIGKVIRERDAAIADLTELSNSLQSCKYCKNLIDGICTWYEEHPEEKENCGDGKFFEWRGVQEVEHEAD